MSTRSAIGFVEYDGTIESIYCHWDGYPEGVGAILANHYTDIEKVGDLLDLGSLSILGTEIGTKHDFDKHRPEDGCLAYGRDRGEENVQSIVTNSLEEFFNAYEWSEYFYWFDGNKWFFCSSNDRTPKDLFEYLAYNSIAA